MVKKLKKKRATTIINADGSKSDGMYRTGGPKKKHTPDEIEAILDMFAKMAPKPATARLAETRDWLIKNLRPYLDGPYATWESARAAGKSGTISALNLDGENGGYFIDPDAPLAVADGKNALHEITCLEHNLATGGGNDLIVRFAINLGVLIERFQCRMMYAPDVLIAAEGRSSSKLGADTINEPYVELHADYQRQVSSRMAEGMKYTPATEAVADLFGVNPRTVQRNTVNPNPRTRK